MATDIQGILHSYELLPDGEKRELAAEILRRSLNLESPPMGDDEFVAAADELFLQLDREESSGA